MITIQSKIDPKYSGTVYPLNQYKGGNGYFFHITNDKDRAMPANEVPADVVAELKPQLTKKWGQ